MKYNGYKEGYREEEYWLKPDNNTYVCGHFFNNIRIGLMIIKNNNEVLCKAHYLNQQAIGNALSKNEHMNHYTQMNCYTQRYYKNNKIFGESIIINI